MFTAVFSICLLADPQTCTLQPAVMARQESFSACLAEARDKAVLVSRQNRDRQIKQIFCIPDQPGHGR